MKLFAIRQISTGLLFPQTGRGATWAEFKPGKVPRLFRTRGAAKQALHWWLAGRSCMGETATWMGGGEYGIITSPVKGRVSEDYEIVEVEFQVRRK